MMTMTMTLTITTTMMMITSGTSLFVQAVTVEQIFMRAELRTPLIPTNILVGVYYYPWHADDFHRGDGYVRKFLQPTPHVPALGEYDDRQSSVIEQHLQWSKQANVQLWVCSWWGPNSREDITIRDAILSHPTLGNHKITLLYEGSGRGIDPTTGWSTENVYSDMAFICTSYFDHPNYYKIQNKPVIVIYLTRVLESHGVLLDVIRLMRQGAMDFCQTELYIIGDHVWGSPPSTAIDSSSSILYPSFEPNMLDAVTK
jgi:hypothetical protein